ncbi:prepilin peptidase [Patescibacteria group bacterium]|nr:prepilin peptidase [Patescibacteria group bacterium]
MIFFYYTISFILGLCFGSFLNALVWRTRENICISKDRSMCPHCRRRLSWYENIPIFSYIFLGGKCRTCRRGITIQYPLVEFFMGLAFVLVVLVRENGEFLLTPEIVRDWFLAFNLGFIFLYDLKNKEILDFSTIPTIIIFIFFAPAIGWHSWQSIGLGVLVGGGIFLTQYLLSRGKWIGGGDIRLGILMGVVLGWPNILVALLLAYVGGAIFSLILVGLKKQSLKSETPFGTYLALATFVVMLWGDSLVAWYMSLLS